MNTKTILLAVGAFGAAGLLFLMGKRSTVAAAVPAATNTAAQGVANWYSVGTQPAQITQAAIEKNWAALDSLFKSQPDFYI